MHVDFVSWFFYGNVLLSSRGIDYASYPVTVSEMT